MRLRTGTRWGVGAVSAVWTGMLIFVCVTLFLRAPRVLSTVNDFDAQIEPITEILVVAAQSGGHLNEEDATRLRRAVLALDTPEGATPSLNALARASRGWLAEPTSYPNGISERALALASEGQGAIATIRPRHSEVYIAVGLAAGGLILALLLVRLLVVRLIAPLEELYHYFDELQVSVSMHLFMPLPALDELETIENALNALVGARLSYLDAQHHGVPFDDQAAADAMLERIKEPVWVVNRKGDLLGANHPALDVLAGEGGVAMRDELNELTYFFVSCFDNADDETMAVPPGWELEIAGDGDAMVCIRTLPSLGAR